MADHLTPVEPDLDEQQTADLHALLAEARARRARELTRAVEHGLGMLPRPLRRIVARVVLR